MRPTLVRAVVVIFFAKTLRMLASDNVWSDAEAGAGGGDRGGKGRGKRSRGEMETLDGDDEDPEQQGKARSAMIFVSKCRR